MSKQDVIGQELQGVVLRGLRDVLIKGQRRAVQLGRPVLVTLVQPLTNLPDPVRLFSASARISECRAFWARPRDEFWIVGAGRAADIHVNGAERFQQATAAHEAMMDSALIEGAENGGPGPVFMGGFRFDVRGSDSAAGRQFPDGLLTLPRWVVSQMNGTCWVSINVVVDGRTDADALDCELQAQVAWLFEPAGDPPSPVGALVMDGLAPGPEGSTEGLHRSVETKASRRWRQGVEEALGAIERGLLTKVTLARTIRVQCASPISPEPVLERLVAEYPECMVFAICRGEACFLGATPEGLVNLHDERMRSTCVAGSVRRGDSDAADLSLSKELLRSVKERREHELTVNWVSERLGELCRKLDWNDPPHVVKLSNIQHLATTFSGVPYPERHVLDFVAALHPTPAVGGLPLGAALKAIRQLEDCGRGWYAGPVGWVDRHNRGEFGVAIRSALLQGNEALLYAGAGIVAGSNPQSEYLETEMKFKPLLSALGVE